MAIVASFDGVNRRIILDASIANSSWTPLDLFKEYLAYRRDNEAFRGFFPLIVMRGGEPKTATESAPRFLQMRTDARGITTKLVLPDAGPYRTRVDGELATDIPDTDPEPFDISGLTTPVIIDYKPTEAEIIKVASGSGLSTAEQERLARIEKFLRNRQHTNAATGKIELYDDAGSVVEYEADIFSDDGTTPYDGTAGIERRDRLETP